MINILLKVEFYPRKIYSKELVVEFYPRKISSRSPSLNFKINVQRRIYFFQTHLIHMKNTFLKKKQKGGAGYGVRTHAYLCTEDLKSSPLTSRANQLMRMQAHVQYISILFSSNIRNANVFLIVTLLELIWHLLCRESC